MDQGPLVPFTPPMGPTLRVPAFRRATLLIDGQAAGTLETANGFNMLVSWSGLDIGLDRGSAVSHYEAPFAFNGLLKRVTVALDPHPHIDGQTLAAVELARQ